MRTGVTNNFELLYGFWEANLSPLRGLQHEIGCHVAQSGRTIMELRIISRLYFPVLNCFYIGKLLETLFEKNNIIHGFLIVFDMCINNYV